MSFVNDLPAIEDKYFLSLLKLYDLLCPKSNCLFLCVTGESDYTEVNSVIVFNDMSSSNMECVNISASEDNLFEPLETFFIFLISDDFDILINQPNATVTIEDSTGEIQSKIFFFLKLEIKFNYLLTNNAVSKIKFY